MASKVVTSSKNAPKGAVKSKSKAEIDLSRDPGLIQQQLYGICLVLDDLKWSIEELKNLGHDHEDRLKLIEHTEIVHSSIIKSLVVTPPEYEQIWNTIMGVEGTVQ